MISYEKFKEAFKTAANDDETHAKLGRDPFIHGLYTALAAALEPETSTKPEPSKKAS